MAFDVSKLHPVAQPESQPISRLTLFCFFSKFVVDNTIIFQILQAHYNQIPIFDCRLQIPERKDFEMKTKLFFITFLLSFNIPERCEN